MRNVPASSVASLLARAQFVEPFRVLFEPWRYKVFHSGRAGLKSWSFAQALCILGARTPLRIWGTREFQTSIKDSVKPLLDDTIRRLRLHRHYKSSKHGIVGRNGTEFKFSGLRVNPDELKGFEGVDICWVEEAQRVCDHSWNVLIPTIRKEGSEIWISFNPCEEADPVYRRFVLNAPANAVVVKTGWRMNPWLSDVLEQERRHMLATDPDAYDWIWEGNCRKISEAVIFRGKFGIETFESPADANFLFGADWGFGPDPTALVRCFEKDGCLFIDAESHAFGLDLDRIAAVWRSAIPGCDGHLIHADSSQPQTIAHVKNFGFRIRGAEKWPGSVEDGIAFLRGYAKIIVHERCEYTGREMRLYSYKTDRVTGEVLPQVLDKNNHCMDAVRYALCRRIKRNKGVF